MAEGSLKKSQFLAYEKCSDCSTASETNKFHIHFSKENSKNVLKELTSQIEKSLSDDKDVTIVVMEKEKTARNGHKKSKMDQTESEAPLDKPRDDGEDRTNLIINYLPQEMSDNELYSMFITCGPIESARIARDRNSGYSYGYGFVKYGAADAAAKAVTNLNGVNIKNKTIKVSYSRPNTENIKDTNLYVVNLPKDTTEEDLDKLFGPFGRILTKKLLKSKGVAFVRFSKKDEANAAMCALHGFRVEGQELSVQIAVDQNKQKAEAFGEAMYYPRGGMGGMGGMGTMGNFSRGWLGNGGGYGSVW